VNPAARHADRASVEDLLPPLRRRWRVDVMVPTDAAGTTRVAAASAADGADAVFAAGGDGTAAAVARGLAGTRTALGILPLGTANDLARALGLRRAPAEAAARAAAREARPMDLLGVGDAVVCTVGGIGIVADSAMAAGRLKGGRGPLGRVARALGGSIYRATAVAALATRRPLAEPLEIEVTAPDGATRSIALSSPGLFAANQRMCGGGLALPGVAADDDGVFELLVIQDVARPRLADAFTRLTLGLPIPASVLRVVPARAARVRHARDDVFLGDGDAVATGREFELRALPRALRVLA
jgi:diacylglycerol kinase (ATP)